MKYILFFLALGFFGCTGAKVTVFNYDQGAIVQRLRTDVEVLASDSLGGRPPGTNFEQKAANYLLLRFGEMGLKGRLLPFEIARDSGKVLQCQNIVAFLDRHADSTILISAHYDHLGMGGEKSLEIRKKGIHYGADDNASGVALMLELARYISRQPGIRYNYAFVAFSGHELGMFGSSDFVEGEYFKKLKVKYLLNFDMVGRLSIQKATIRFSYCLDKPELFDLAQIDNPQGIYVLQDAGGNTVNDFSVFCEAGYPAISITTGIHDDYHRTGDIAARINYDGMYSILGYVLRVLAIP